MKSKSHHIWLFWLLWHCVIFLRITSVKLVRCKDTNYCEVISEYEALPCTFRCSENGAKIEVTLMQDKVSISCRNGKSDYLKLIENLNMGKTKSINKFEIKNCPISNVPYIDIFNAFNTKPIEIFDLDTVSDSDFLEPHHFANLSSVTHLNIIRSKIKELPEELFTEMINLKYLSLASNRLQKLSANIFKPLRNLEELCLDNNSLSSLDENIFQFLSNLEYLELNYNHFDDLEINVFSPLTKLKSLEMNGNQITTLKSGIFDPLKNLVNLSLSDNNLSRVPSSPFVKNSNLRRIYMNHAFFDKNFTLPPELFTNLNSLKILDLRKNDLTFLDDRLFSDTTNLEELYLGENILSLSNDPFQNLRKLKILEISNNLLREVKMETFLQLENLKKLDLSSNQLTSAFEGRISFGNRMKVNFRNNSLNKIHEELNPTVFNPVQEVDLSFNNFTTLSTEDFTNFAQAESSKINLNNNQIKSIDLNISRLQKKKYSSGDPVVTFTIKENPIDCNCEALHLAQYIRNTSYPGIIISPDGALCKTPNILRNVPLEDVNLTMLKCPIEENCPKGKKQNCSCYYRSSDDTVEVNCTSAGIREFPQQLPIYEDKNKKSTDMHNTNHSYELFFANNDLTSMQGLNNLSEHFIITGIYLSNNRLENIEDIPHLKALRILKLDNNHLKYLSEQTVNLLWKGNNLKSITLHNNPWDCDCHAKHLWSFIKSNDMKIANRENIQCKGNGTFINLLTENDLCPMQVVIMVLCILVIFAFLSTAAVILYHKFKLELKLWIFMHPYLRFLVTETEVDEDKLFDAFVSHAHEDHDFVEYELRPKLEDTYMYKLCVYYRDFLPGQFIPNVITNVVESSRRTIIILSTNFIESTWCQKEFIEAHLQGIKERCRRVIVIMLEDVTNHEKLHPELKAYINTNIYLKPDDPKFYHKLALAMPHRSTHTAERRELLNRSIAIELQERTDRFIQSIK